MKHSAEEFSRAGEPFLGRSYDEMDCQAFVERCMRAVGLDMDLGGSNSWYREVMRNGWVGTPEECVKAFGSIPNGALLFILEPVSASTPVRFRNDGIGDATHIGIRTGRGKGAIHSSRSKGCVCESEFHDRTVKNGGWNRVGLYNRFDYGTTVNWHLEHSLSEQAPEGGKDMRGTVVAESGSTVNLRKKPGLGWPLVERLPVGTAVQIVGESGDWYAVEAGGKSGWMMKQYVRMGEGGETPATGGLFTVTIPNLDGETADALVRRYPGAEKAEVRG